MSYKRNEEYKGIYYAGASQRYVELEAQRGNLTEEGRDSIKKKLERKCKQGKLFESNN